MKNYLLFGITLILIDFLTIWLFINEKELDPSSTILVLQYVPLTFILNLILATLFFFIKKKTYSYIFILNGLVASTIMYYSFQNGLEKYANQRWEKWEFLNDDKAYSLTRYKKTNKFSILESSHPGSAWSYINGTYEETDNGYLLVNDSVRMEIKLENLLIGFNNLSDTIQMRKIK